MHSELSISCPPVETTSSKDLLLVALLVLFFLLALKCKMIMFGWPTSLRKVHRKLLETHGICCLTQFTDMVTLESKTKKG